jgi:hypothetical protein
MRGKETPLKVGGRDLSYSYYCHRTIRGSAEPMEQGPFNDKLSAPRTPKFVFTSLLPDDVVHQEIQDPDFLLTCNRT